MRRGIVWLSRVVLVDLAVLWIWTSIGSVSSDAVVGIIGLSVIIVLEGFGYPRVGDWIVIVWLGVTAVAGLVPRYTFWNNPLVSLIAAALAFMTWRYGPSWRAGSIPE